MSDEAATEADTEVDQPGEDGVWSRETAPQTPFTLREVGIGLVIAVVGAAVAFGLPLALA
jgi:hypothetical protein